MTASARRRLGLRKSFALWLTPQGKMWLGAVGFALFLLAAWALSAAFGG